MARYDNMLTWKINEMIGYAIKCGYVHSPEGPIFSAWMARMAMQHTF